MHHSCAVILNNYKALALFFCDLAKLKKDEGEGKFTCDNLIAEGRFIIYAFTLQRAITRQRTESIPNLGNGREY